MRQAVARRRKRVVVKEYRQAMSFAIACQVPRRIAQKLDEPMRARSRKHLGQRAKLGLDFRGERILERCAQCCRVIGDEVTQPLLAFGEQTRQQSDEAVGIVVQVVEQTLPRPFTRAGFVERRTRGFDVQRLGAFDHARHRAQFHRQRRLSRKRETERIDRMHLQARGVRDQVPAERGIAPQRRAREAPGERKVRLCRRRSFCLAQRDQDPVANLARSLAGESHRDDRLGALDARQQREKTLQQQFGLARSRGRLDDERSRDIQGRQARVAVALGPAVIHRRTLRLRHRART